MCCKINWRVDYSGHRIFWMEINPRWSREWCETINPGVKRWMRVENHSWNYNRTRMKSMSIEVEGYLPWNRRQGWIPRIHLDKARINMLVGLDSQRQKPENAWRITTLRRSRTGRAEWLICERKMEWRSDRHHQQVESTTTTQCPRSWSGFQNLPSLFWHSEKVCASRVALISGSDCGGGGSGKRDTEAGDHNPGLREPIRLCSLPPPTSRSEPPLRDRICVAPWCMPWLIWPPAFITLLGLYLCLPHTRFAPGASPVSD
jgi:hypothetical protein